MNYYKNESPKIQALRNGKTVWAFGDKKGSALLKADGLPDHSSSKRFFANISFDVDGSTVSSKLRCKF